MPEEKWIDLSRSQERGDQLIGQMPKKGRQLYEMFCGREAKHWLDDALASATRTNWPEFPVGIFTPRPATMLPFSWG